MRASLPPHEAQPAYRYTRQASRPSVRRRGAGAMRLTKEGLLMVSARTLITS
jgi:hypothetical protein